MNYLMIYFDLPLPDKVFFGVWALLTLYGAIHDARYWRVGTSNWNDDTNPHKLGYMAFAVTLGAFWPIIVGVFLAWRAWLGFVWVIERLAPIDGCTPILDTHGPRCDPSTCDISGEDAVRLREAEHEVNQLLGGDHVART